MTMIENIPEECRLSPAFHEYMVFGVQAPVPNYWTRLAQREIERHQRIEQLLRMKALVTMIDVLEVCEAA